MQPSRIFVRTGIVVMLLMAGLITISLFTTSPDDLGPYGITLWFVVLLAALGGVFATVLFSYKKLTRRGQRKAFLAGESLRQGILLSVWVTSIIALNSLRQLSWRDVVLLTLLLILVEFYMRRGSSRRNF